MLSKLSEQRLARCHPDLQRVVRLAADRVRIMVLCGYRNEVDQRAAYINKFSRVDWPNSLHNQLPARAVDCAPLPLDWHNIAAFDAMALAIKNASADLAISIVWGGDWHGFKDRPHFELPPDS